MADDSMKMNITYPFSEDFEYESYLERINLDETKNDDIKMGRGFIIQKPEGIKKDIKNRNGIFDKRYGSNSISDVDSFTTVYRCDCGRTFGSIRTGEVCPICKQVVKYIGDDVNITGYLVLKDPYYIIHPNIYRTIEAFIGASRLNRIIEPDVNVNLDGAIIDNSKIKKFKKDEPFAGIGILEFKDRFIEIMDFYIKKYPNKSNYYEDLLDLYNCGLVFTHTISVYSSLLRPSSIDDGTLKYEACNDQFYILSNLVYACNNDKLHIYKKKKNKLAILYDIQTNLNDVYVEIKEILSKKKGKCIAHLYYVL